jgi:putative flippase GtrA
MEIIQKLYKKFFSGSFMRYLFVGTTTVAIDFVLLVLLHGKLGINISIATSIAYWVSIAYNFILNRFWTFSVSEKDDLHKHIMFYLVLLGFNYLFTVVFVTFVSKYIDYTIAKVLAITFQITWTYPVYKKVIFVHKPANNME